MNAALRAEPSRLREKHRQENPIKAQEKWLKGKRTGGDQVNNVQTAMTYRQVDSFRPSLNLRDH